MSLAFDKMRRHPDLAAIIRTLSSAFVEHHDTDQRLSAIFSTQQRWLLAHAAMALYFRGEAGVGAQLHSKAFLKAVEENGIAARNTAHSFLKQMISYRIAHYRAAPAKNNVRLIDLSEPALLGITYWLNLHLAALDAFDGGARSAIFQKYPGSTVILQPAVADNLISSGPMRLPVGPFSLFTWLNGGGLVMDWLMLGLKPVAEGAKQIPTNVTSASELAGRLKISRTNLGRKLREAEEIGSIGWLGLPGKSTMWISADFRDEYYNYQICKLALIDSAFDTVRCHLNK